MKLTKTLEAELKQLYDDYMESMFTGNLRKYKSFLAEHFKQIGTTSEEIWFSKNEVLKYFKASIVPVGGNIEKRNGHIWMGVVDELVLIIEQADVYVNVDGVWTFYDKAR
ncbi:MAG TPA: nuclear transport factor 2 family protein, partial [Chitinophagaceae bacterium]|nr:nuclear transport factor 2 family protein [Chitinophagaceae bacterium]